MNLKRENGSAVTIVIVVLVLALLGGLGYVFWGKLNNVSIFGFGKQTSQSEDAAKASSNMKTASFDKSFGIIMNFKYPKTWSIDKKDEGTFPVTTNGTSIEAFIVTSPDKKYSVVYRLGAGGGVGGTCGRDEAATIVAADSANVDGWKGVKLVRAITKTKADKYVSKVSLMSTSIMSNVKVGGNACDFDLGVIKVPSMTLNLMLLDASIHGKTDMNITYGTPNQGVSSEKEVRQLFSGKSFDEARAILLSTTLK